MNKLSENPEVKEKIRNELFQCMLEMPYNKITVKNLVERLQMSRQNFYRYYISKDDILLDLIDRNLDVVYELVDSYLDSTNPDITFITDSIITLFIPKKELVHEVLSCTNEVLVFSHIHHFVRRVIGKLLRNKERRDIDENYLDIVISQYSGSLYHLTKSWAQTDSELEISKLNHLLIVYVNNLFKEVDNTRVYA